MNNTLNQLFHRSDRQLSRPLKTFKSHKNLQRVKKQVYEFINLICICNIFFWPFFDVMHETISSICGQGQCINNHVVFCASCFFNWFSFTNIRESQDCRGRRKGEAISFYLLCHFHPLLRHLDITRAITAESSRLHITSDPALAGNPFFLSSSR